MNKPNASLAIQVLPKVEGEEVIRIVDKVIEYLKSTSFIHLQKYYAYQYRVGAQLRGENDSGRWARSIIGCKESDCRSMI